jgi:hypothetical protein
LSSILRALKKLENEPRHLDETQPLDSKFVPLADTSPKKSPAGILFMVIGGGIVCGLVILAGWWLFSEKTLSPPAVPQQTSQQNLQQSEKAAAKLKELEISERPYASVEPAKPILDMTAIRGTTDQGPELPQVQTPQPLSVTIEQKEAISADKQTAGLIIKMPETTSTEISDQVSAEKVAVPVTRAPEVTTKIEEVEIPLLKDPDMKLQAITWSKNPQKRIAVINNRILRQGEVAHGYRVDTINQDDVVLSDGGEKWKLLFRIQ